MCRLLRRSSRLLDRRRCGLAAGHIRDSARRAYGGCARSFWPGSWTSCHLQSARPISSETKRMRRRAQSYVRKRPISKRIRRVIRRFMVFAFHAPRFLSGSGEGPRNAMEGWPALLLTHAASDGWWVKRPRIFRNSARAVLRAKRRTARRAGGGAMRSRPLWQLCDTAPERRRGRAAWSRLGPVSRRHH